jgi:hypothetical protein
MLAYMIRGASLAPIESRLKDASVIVLAVVAVENPAVLARTLAKLFRQRRALPSRRCEHAASGKATSILELRSHIPRPRQRICLAVRPCMKLISSRSRMMLRMEHPLRSLAALRPARLTLQTKHRQPPYSAGAVLQVSERNATRVRREDVVPGNSGGHFEDFVDETIMMPGATPAQPPHLALPNYVHRLIALNRSSRSLEFAKPLLGLHSPV